MCIYILVSPSEPLLHSDSLDIRSILVLESSCWGMLRHYFTNSTHFSLLLHSLFTGHSSSKASTQHSSLETLVFLSWSVPQESRSCEERCFATWFSSCQRELCLLYSQQSVSANFQTCLYCFQSSVYWEMWHPVKWQKWKHLFIIVIKLYKNKKAFQGDD